MAESTQLQGPTMMADPVALADGRDREAARCGLPLLRQLQVPLNVQYQEPGALSKKWIGLYARHVARTFPHQTKPDRKVIGVKVYKALHSIIGPGQLAQGLEPDDPTLYMPYYMGEFDKDGNMKPSCLTMEWKRDREVWDVAQDADGHYKRDGLLYWLIPIIRPPQSDPKLWLQQKPINYVLQHAGDVDAGDLP
jgi:hypothetical protein